MYLYWFFWPPPFLRHGAIIFIYGQNTHIYGKYASRSQEWRIHDTKPDDKTPNSLEKKWVYATNSDFLVPKSFEPNVLHLRYFKLWILLDEIILVRRRWGEDEKRWGEGEEKVRRRWGEGEEKMRRRGGEGEEKVRRRWGEGEENVRRRWGEGEEKMRRRWEEWEEEG